MFSFVVRVGCDGVCSPALPSFLWRLLKSPPVPRACPVRGGARRPDDRGAGVLLDDDPERAREGLAQLRPAPDVRLQPVGDPGQCRRHGRDFPVRVGVACPGAGWWMVSFPGGLLLY